jgi:hypothetical protein
VPHPPKNPTAPNPNLHASLRVRYFFPRAPPDVIYAFADTQYATADGFAKPVIIHRAVMGSMERMIAILCEHYAGKWPLWISPRQIMIVPISEVSMGERPSSFTARRLSR